MANLMGGRGGGRKREHEWSEFNDIEGDEGKTLVECSHCGEKVSKRIQRIKNHLEKCRVKNKQDKAVEDINENNIPIPPPPKRSRVMDTLCIFGGRIRTKNEKKRIFNKLRFF